VGPTRRWADGLDVVPRTNDRSASGAERGGFSHKETAALTTRHSDLRKSRMPNAFGIVSVPAALERELARGYSSVVETKARPRRSPSSLGCNRGSRYRSTLTVRSSSQNVRPGRLPPTRGVTARLPARSSQAWDGRPTGWRSDLAQPRCNREERRVGTSALVIGPSVLLPTKTFASPDEGPASNRLRW
jgi:hypothetical protein